MTHRQFRLSTLLWITLAVACWFGGRTWQRQIDDDRIRFSELGFRPGPDFVEWVQFNKWRKQVKVK
jgi:hypothetical protein